MSSLIRTVTVDCADPYALAGFWSEVMGWPRGPEDEPGDEEVGIVAPQGAGPGLLFIRVPEGKTVKNRLHLDLEPQQPRDAEIERVLTLGATLVDDLRNPNGTGWAVLADPEGNEFCILRSAAERAATSSI